MKTPVVLSIALSTLFSFSVSGPASGQDEDDIFAFIPAGGRTLLETVREAGLPQNLAARIAETGGDHTVWREALDAEKAGTPALGVLDDWQTNTLANYLAANTPLDPGGVLPRDGRDMALQLCQSCHIITVVITQDRTREAWLGTMNSPSHVEIETTEAERGLLADYLVINAGIPIDLVPPELRAGGASY
ncbi:hypothetical protein SAMN05444414_12060 [Roseovarius marisflavi]|uniref:Cytochrome c domain-containing protein n=1 Tax=Roseovarius marisflavi TaxID=1054996 RepID=A0A1M7BRV4_9RHOB|nr:hypothetical protein [Roseovarius marisflavi]SHL57663.1 hypothetical protein SAMN05444414_12060 [Roseovarius marisflavi]